MSCDWEGNRRSGVALAMRHRLKWFIHLRAQGLSKGDEHPTNTPHGVWYSLPFRDRQVESMPVPHHFKLLPIYNGKINRKFRLEVRIVFTKHLTGTYS